MPLQQTRQVAVIGVGMTAMARRSDRIPPDLSAEALRLAIEDAGLDHKDVDGP
jgi:acetyl-CoA acetyltransferase